MQDVDETPSGVTAKETEMNALNTTAAKSTSGLMSILFVACLGAATIFMSGLASSATLHDAAHDMRHSTGFPCH